MKSSVYTKILLTVLIIAFILAGCGSNQESQNTRVAASAVQTPDAVVQAEASASKAMPSGDANSVTARSVTDMAGRTVEIPSEIKKVYTTSQIGIIVLFTLNPDKLAGWGFALTEDDRKFIDQKYYDLPVLGTWSGKNGTGNIEEIIRVHPDVILSIGTIDDSQKSLSDKIQEQTGIPVVMIDGPLDKLDKMYEMAGDILGEQARAKELADYCAKTISDMKAITTKIPEDKRVKVYYAEGPKGLETDPKGSFHTEVLDFINGINVAEVPMQSGYGRTAVSLEQLLKWDPEVIIAGYDKDAKAGFFKDIYSTPEWMGIRAVKDKKVYSIPNRPFDWFDRPPSVNRIIGVKWLANLLYPEYVKLDMHAEVKDFYSKFYHTELTEQEVEELLSEAGGK